MRFPLTTATRLALVWAAVGTIGCGGDDQAESDPPQRGPADPPNLITKAYIEAQVRQQSGSLAARVVLEFWRDVQYSNFPVAYSRLGSSLRARSPYGRFVRAFQQAQPLFLYRPRIRATERNGNLTSVYLLLQQGLRPSRKDPPFALNTRREGARWVVATDPRNVLGTSVGTERTP